MIIVFSSKASEQQIFHVEKLVQSLGLVTSRTQGLGRTTVAVIGDTSTLDPSDFRVQPGVTKVLRISSPFKLTGREFHPENTVVKVGDVAIGGKEIVVIAGPCAVESRQQIADAAEAVSKSGAGVVRGGAFKPRTSPYSFQGLGEQGLIYIREEADRMKLPLVSEVMTIQQIPIVSKYADMLQVGTRNMHNFPLLTELGRTGKPILLKRGHSATIEEWLMSAEYILREGNPNVVLCERGIRTFEKATRFTLDISSVPVVKRLSHLPIIVDPSHSAGDRGLVHSLANAAIAAGADGLMVEVHPTPDTARSDGCQSLNPEQFHLLMESCKKVAAAVGREMPDGGGHV